MVGWVILRAQHRAQIERIVTERQAQITAVLENELRQLVQALGRMASRWETNGTMTQELWTIDAQNYLDNFGYYQAIEWADPSFKVQWIEPLEGNEQAQGLDLSFEPRRREALIAARETGTYTSTKSIDLVQGGKGFIIFYPIGSRETFGGFILGVFRIESLFSKLTTQLRSDFAIEVREDGAVIYSSFESKRGTSYASATLTPARVDVLGNEWSLALYPRLSFLNTIESHVPALFLGAGLLLAASLSGLTYFGMMTLQTLGRVKTSESNYRELAAQLDVLSHLDALTGIPNRRAFDKALKNEWRRAQREKKPLGIILIDIDHFKRYNDNYGHQAGDDCLRRVAEQLDARITRAGDFMARYGGEEFVLILPNTDENGVTDVAKKLHAAVAEAQIPHEYSDNSDYVTISLGGAAGKPIRDASAQSLVELADRALYLAKGSGRNQFQFYDEKIP